MQRAASDPGKVLYSVSIGLIVLGLVLGFAVLPRALSTAGVAGGASVGKDAPDFSLPVVLNPGEGAAAKATVTMSELRGRPVLIDFWATWCGPCRAEAPSIERIARRYKDRGLVVLGVNTSDEEGNAAPVARSLGLSFPIAYDVGSRAAHAYGVENLPTLVVIGKSGKIVAVRSGLTDDIELERLVTEAL